MTLNEIRTIILKIVPPHPVPIDLRLFDSFPIKRDNCAAYFIRDFGYLFAAPKGKGTLHTNIEDFLNDLPFDRTDKVAFLIFDSSKNKKFVKIFIPTKSFTIPIEKLSFEAVQTPNKFAKPDPQENVSSPSIFSISKRETLDGAYALENLNSLKADSIPALSNFVNHLIHQPNATLFSKKTWREIGIAVTRVLPSVFLDTNRARQEMALELMARSVPFLTSSERVAAIKQLFEVIHEHEGLPTDIVEKISSIILVSSSSVDPNDLKLVALRTLAKFNTNKSLSSNLAKLIRKFL